ncbi:MAG: flavodoxin family protein [Euryarchaeota archaeon]|jgi:multimeric flavodoxin WrbA|nr:flavodoxin family protein [Euryarchaeota archaeon]
MVKVMGIVGSPRKDGNTHKLVEAALYTAQSAGATVELLTLYDKEMEPCIACDICRATGECAIYDDVPGVLERMVESDGIIIGSPVYFGNVTSQLKILMDRSRPLRRDFQLKNKVCGALSVGASRNGGQETTIQAIHHYLLIQDAIVVGDGEPLAHYGGTGVGGPVGDVDGDEAGLETSQNLGRRVAELARLINP